MKRAVFLLFIGVLSVVPSLALEIKGEVLTLEGKPVEGAVILHRLSQAKTLTDEMGQFRLQVQDAERIKLEIIHPDYLEQEVIISYKEASRKTLVRLIPLIRQREEIVVTAMRYPESSAKVPAAQAVISKENLEEKMIPNITQGLQDIPGVSSIGAGGFSIVPNIRGLARRRVLILIDNARVISDRRTGPNASFIDPRDVEKIEVLRSPSSVFYGSDAIGGVIHIFTKKPSSQKALKGELNLKYGSVNQEKGIGFSLQGKTKKTGFCLSFHANDAENYSSPFSEVLMSQFTQGSLLGKISFSTEEREVDISFLGARGHDIGKPNRDSLSNPTWYPLESQNLIQFRWLEKGVRMNGELEFQAYLNPHFLETKKEKIQDFKSKESYSKTQSFDFGLNLSYGKMMANKMRIKGGADFFGRIGAKARNVNTYFDPAGRTVRVLEEWPFTEGRRNDLGFFISADYTGVKNLDLVGGIRLDFIQMKARPGNAPSVEKSSHVAWTGFLGGSAKLSETIVLFANFSRAFRAPSLNELFYTGITGRGFIIAQPDLDPEMSLNLDGGVKFINKRFFMGLYAFYYNIDDMIERYRAAETIYTYGNIIRGKISGYELELEYYPFPGWKIFGHYFSFRGKSQKTENSLNDVPALQLFLGTRLWIKKFTAEVNALFKANKKNPGPAEIEIPSYEVVNIQLSYFIDSSFRFYLHLSNLFNKTYLARPDPDSIEEPGRNFILGLSYSF